MMASESCASIIDWLSEVEASGNTQDSSLSSATSSPSSPPSAFSSPCLTGSLYPRKRKLDPDNHQPVTESLYLVKHTRKALREIMPPNGNKRPRRDTASENDVQGVEFEVWAISEAARLFIIFTVIDSVVLPTRPKRANPPPRPSSTYRLLGRANPPRPPDLMQRPLVAPGRRFRPP